jgi:hypothetical protein
MQLEAAAFCQYKSIIFNASCLNGVQHAWERNVYSVLVLKSEERDCLENVRCICDDNIKTDLKQGRAMESAGAG